MLAIIIALNFIPPEVPSIARQNAIGHRHNTKAARLARIGRNRLVFRLSLISAWGHTIGRRTGMTAER